MNFKQFVEVVEPLAEYYGRPLSPGAIQLYFEAAKDYEIDHFQRMVQRHMADHEAGRFFPTLAHLVDKCDIKPPRLCPPLVAED